MDRHSITLWTQPKTSVYFGVILVTVVDLAGIVLTILYWDELNWITRSALIASFVLSIPFLGMYVMACQFGDNQLVLKLPHTTSKIEQGDIVSVRVVKKRTGDYLELQTAKPIGIRKRFYFVIDKNEAQVAEVLNYLLLNGIKVYANSNLDTKVKFNPAIKRFE